MFQSSNVGTNLSVYRALKPCSYVYLLLCLKQLCYRPSPTQDFSDARLQRLSVLEWNNARIPLLHAVRADIRRLRLSNDALQWSPRQKQTLQSGQVPKKHNNIGTFRGKTCAPCQGVS